MSEMAKDFVATRRIIACHLEGVYRRREPGLFLPESEAACNRTLLLPMFVGLSEAEQDLVIQSLQSALDKREVILPQRHKSVFEKGGSGSRGWTLGAD